MRAYKWIDVLKGIGIASIVAGHVVASPQFVALLFVFHVPLFFLIGGWLHQAATPQREYLQSKSRALLLPYISYLLILWPLELRAAFPDQPWNLDFIVRSVLKPMLLGGPLLKGYCAVFWFVTCYFLTQQLVHYLVRRQSPRVCQLLCAAMLAIAYLQAWLLPHWLPWNVHTVLFAAPLYYLGYRAHGLDLRRLVAPAGALAAAGLALNLAGVHNYVDLKYLDYGIPLATAFVSVACCILLARLAQKLETNWIGTALASIGSASLTIMFTHQFVQLELAGRLGMHGALSRTVAALAFGWLLHRLVLKTPLLALLFAGAGRIRRAAPSAAHA